MWKIKEQSSLFPITKKQDTPQPECFVLSKLSQLYNFFIKNDATILLYVF